MDETLVTDLLAIVRRSTEAPGRLLAERLAGLPAGPSVAELEELVRRARACAAGDEELGLSLAALLATTRKNAP
ncbi:MAG TPA: hypothetical protein VFZ53_14860 [Polyangiaceae bacterium]